jgi:hypothetical protein
VLKVEINKSRRKEENSDEKFLRANESKSEKWNTVKWNTTNNESNKLLYQSILGKTEIKEGEYE